MRKKLRLGRLNSRILHPIQDLFRPLHKHKPNL